jgi:hypothetical protein
MATYVLGLLADAGPNDGVPFPASPATHFDKVDENPHDSDTTRIRQTASGDIEAFTVDTTTIPNDEPILSVAIRWTQAGDTNSDSHVGWRIGGVYYTSSSRAQLVHLYSTFNETALTANPATGLPWTKQDIAAAQIIHQQDAKDFDIAYPRLTQLVPVVVTGDAIRRVSADAASMASSGALSGSASSGAPVSLSPVADAASLASVAAPTGLAPTARPVSIAYASDPASRAPMATAANLNDLTATGASLAPQATGIESMAHEADGVPLLPPSGGGE